MTTLLNLRFIQIRRELKDLGMRSFFIAPVIVALVLWSFVTYLKTPDAYYFMSFMVIVCMAIQTYRADKNFVFSHIHQPNFQLFSEYFLFTFPFTVGCMLTQSWFCYPLFLIVIYLITFIKTDLKHITHFRNLSYIIPASHFEIISGFRKSFFFLIPIYLLAIGFCWFTILPLFLLWFITITIVSFYDECEPQIILKEGNLQPNNFLKLKLIQHSKYLLVLYTPLLLINTLLNFDFLIVNLLFIPVQISLLSFAICFKYTLYQPNVNLKANSIVLSLVAIGSILPFLLPIPLLMAMYYYRKAKKNLNYYLND